MVTDVRIFRSVLRNGFVPRRSFIPLPTRLLPAPAHLVPRSRIPRPTFVSHAPTSREPSLFDKLRALSLLPVLSRPAVRPAAPPPAAPPSRIPVLTFVPSAPLPGASARSFDRLRKYSRLPVRLELLPPPPPPPPSRIPRLSFVPEPTGAATRSIDETRQGSRLPFRFRPSQPRGRRMVAVTDPVTTTTPSLKSALKKRGPAVAKKVKQVHFGGRSVRTISRWIED